MLYTSATKTKTALQIIISWVTGHLPKMKSTVL